MMFSFSHHQTCWDLWMFNHIHPSKIVEYQTGISWYFHMCWLMLKSPKHVCMVGASQHPTAKLRHRNRAVFFRHTWRIWSCPQLGSAEKSRKILRVKDIRGRCCTKYYGTTLEKWWWILILPHRYADSFGGFWRCSSIVFQRYLTVTEQNISWLFSAKLQILELGSIENFGGFRFTTHLEKQLSTLDSAEKNQHPEILLIFEDNLEFSKHVCWISSSIKTGFFKTFAVLWAGKNGKHHQNT